MDPGHQERLLASGVERERSYAKTVEGFPLAFEGVDDVHGGDRGALAVLGVGDGVADDVGQEDLESVSNLVVGHCRDALDPAASSQSSDRRLGDALDVFAEDFAVPLHTTFAQSFALALAQPFANSQSTCHSKIRV